MLYEIPSKTIHKDKKGDQYRKKSKTLDEANPVKNINKNPHSFHINCKTMHISHYRDIVRAE